MGFTDFLQRGEEESSSGNMLRFLTITLLVAYATASQKLAKKIHKDMLVMNSVTACWGKGNMLAFKVGMKQAMETCMNENHSGLLKPANPLLALLNQNAETLPFPTNNNPFQSLPAQIIQKMEFLDSNLQINMKYYSGDGWNKLDLVQTMAGEDPEWREMLEDSYKDCYDIARSFPQSALNRNPLTKVFGRHMVFFKCTKKAETKACGMACANDMLSTLYGTNDEFNWSQYGLPQNKYERAAKTMMVMYGAATKEEGFVHEFFFTDPLL